MGINALIVGQPIVPPTASAVIYTDGSNNVGADANFTYDGSGQVTIAADGAGDVPLTVQMGGDTAADAAIIVNEADGSKVLDIGYFGGGIIRGFSGGGTQRYELNEFTFTFNPSSYQLIFSGQARIGAFATGVRIFDSGGSATGYIRATHIPDVVTLIDAATIATDASLSNRFKVAIAVDRILGAPTNPTEGQECRWRVENTDASPHTLTLTTGSAGAFRFGTTITTIPAIAAGTVTYITAQYDSTDDRWDVIGLAEGF